MAAGSDPTLRSVLHERHVAAAADMRPLDGWDVPVSYGDPDGEYRRLRSRAGVLDLSHVGRIRVRGDGALDMLDHLCTADVARQEDDTALYTLLLDEAGRIVDHALLARLERFWLLTCSPSRRPAVLDHLRRHAEAFGAKVDDQTFKTAMLGVIGPAAGAILDRVLPEPASRLPRRSARLGTMLVARYIALRAGPTRLWSIEVVLPRTLAAAAWGFITGKAGANAIAPAGLAAREVLRIEAGVPACGREIGAGADPIAADLAGCVDFGKDFLGAEALRAARDRPATQRRVGLVLAGAGEGRSWSAATGAAVCDAGGQEVGRLTSAAFSPAVGRPIAMAQVSAERARPGERLSVRLAAGDVGAEVVELPFPV